MPARHHSIFLLTHWWSPPKQRQRWRDSRVLPRHGNWTQIFFDLFYVAGCINLGTILKESAFEEDAMDHARAILYFFGTAFPVFLMWFDKLHYDARFAQTSGMKKIKPQEHGAAASAAAAARQNTQQRTDKETAAASQDSRGGVGGFLKSCVGVVHGDHHNDHDHANEEEEEEDDDLFHRLLELIQVCAVATALSRIRSPDVMSNFCEHNDMFLFALSLSINSLITIGRYLEVRLFVVECDLPAAKVAAARDMQRLLIPTLFYILAAIDSGYGYYVQYNNDARDSDDDYCQTVPSNDTPIICCLAGWFANVCIGYYFDVLAYAKRGEEQSGGGGNTKHRRMVEMSVPLNVHFCMHRYREWFMLMFGESIISLLIVDGHNESPQYKIAFFSGILSVIVLAHWHYGAEPRSPDEHAISRSRHSSYLYSALIPIYSAFLVAVGVCYKLFLYEYTYSHDDDNASSAHRRILAATTEARFLGGDHNNGDDHYSYQNENYDNYDNSNNPYNYYDYDNTQYYGAEDDAEYSHGHYSQESQERHELQQQFAANLFCGSMAMVMICMDLRALLHKGLPWLRRQARNASPLVLVAFWVSRYSVVTLLATFSIHHNDPHIMALFCLGAMLLLELLSNLFSRHLQRRGGGGKGAASNDSAVGQEASHGATNGGGEEDDSVEVWISSIDEDDDNDSTWFETESTTAISGIHRHTLALFEREALFDEGLLREDGLATIPTTRHKRTRSSKSDVELAVATKQERPDQNAMDYEDMRGR